MKIIKLASALALVMGVASTAMAGTAGGTITFTGAVNDTTCTVSGGSGTNGGAANFSVALDTVDANVLNAAGITANPKAFNVTIGGSDQPTCTAGKIANMSFLPSSTQIDPTTGSLKNSLSGQATNVQIQLTDSTSAPINLATGGQTWSTTIGADNTGTIAFNAQYQTVGGAATPGLVNTNVVYQVVYN